MAGAGTVGVGGVGSGVGVGGWQIYESVNPTLDRQLSREGYKWDPAKISANDNISNENNKFNWSNWGCVEKLFKNVSITHTESNTTDTSFTPQKITLSPPNNSKTIYLNEHKTVDKNDFLVCALLDKREGHNKVYFKSEVVVRDKEHGWIMWNGLSNAQNNSNAVFFQYRLLTLKKSGDSWTIDKGFGWDSPITNSSASTSIDDLVIKIPAGWWRYSSNAGAGYSSRQTWLGIAKLDETTSESPVHLVKSMKIYMKKDGGVDNQYAEFFGGDGKWEESSGVGYQQANKAYDTTNNAGWKTLSTNITLGDSLEYWYKPLREKGVKWNTCDSWASSRKTLSQEDSWDKTMKEMCYRKTSQTS